MAGDDFLARVRQRTGFALPELYIRMQRDGLLRYGDSREEWLAHWRQICLTRPPALICTGAGAVPVEWFTVEEMQDWTAPEYWKPDIIIAFAGNGAGDVWTWFPRLRKEHGVPVVFCFHDQNEAQVYAPDFEAFLYRALLDTWTYIDAGSVEGFDGGIDAFQKYLQANVAVLEPYLRPEWFKTLQEIVHRPLEYHEQPRRGRFFRLTTEEEIRSFLAPEVFTGLVSTTFEHMEP